MSSRGNKSTELRKKVTEEKLSTLQSHLSHLVQEEVSKIKSRDNKKKTVVIASPTILQAGEEGKRGRERLLKNQEQCGLTDEHTFTPTISKKVPDYKKLQDKFEQKLASKKSLKPPTMYYTQTSLHTLTL